MHKVLITGSEGFIGKFLVEELIENNYDVYRADTLCLDDTVINLNVLDYKNVYQCLDECKPDYVFHLAGQANVPKSWISPQETLNLNVNGIINIIYAIKELKLNTKIICMGSSDEYGFVGNNGDGIDETYPLNPTNPYAISKVAQESMALTLCKAFGIPVVAIRLFNVFGPGQKTGYMITDFAYQIAQVKHKKQESIYVGNLDAARDYTYITDAARALRLLAEEGRSGEVYNIGSGYAYSAKQILDSLINIAEINVEIKVDKEKLRPIDVPVVRCNHNKLTLDTAWAPVMPINEALHTVLDYWNRNI